MTKNTEASEGAATVTATEIATHLGINPKALRRFLRSDASPLGACGKGNRYGFSPDEAKVLIAAFAARPTKATAATRTAEELAELLG